MLFGLLPPEVNSGRMYSGPGSGPLRAAATAWDNLAEQMYLAAAAHRSEISALVGHWKGPSSAAMAAAVQPFTTWMVTVAGQAEHTAAQAVAAATAFEHAFAATVPPPVIAANRTQLALLVATNFLGQNTPAIAATEAHYAEMWAQDAAAMYGYAASASAASVLRPFSSPPDTADSNGAANQGFALAQDASTAAGAHTESLSQVVSAATQSIHGVAAADVGLNSSSSSAVSAFSALDGYFTGPLSPFLLYGVGAIPELLAAQCYLLPQAMADSALAPDTAVSVGGGALGTGTESAPVAEVNTIWAEGARADLVGQLSVPPGWAVTAPTAKTAAVTLTSINPANPADAAAVSAEYADGLAGQAAPALLANGGNSGLFAETGLSTLAGRASGSVSHVRTRGAAVAMAENVSNIFVIPEVGE